jgi:hypothetical protein
MPDSRAMPISEWRAWFSSAREPLETLTWECGLTNGSKPSSLTSLISYDLFSDDLIDGLRNVLRLATAHIPMYSCDPCTCFWASELTAE